MYLLSTGLHWAAQCKTFIEWRCFPTNSSSWLQWITVWWRVNESYHSFPVQTESNKKAECKWKQLRAVIVLEAHSSDWLTMTSDLCLGHSSAKLWLYISNHPDVVVSPLPGTWEQLKSTHAAKCSVLPGGVSRFITRVKIYKRMRGRWQGEDRDRVIQDCY